MPKTPATDPLDRTLTIGEAAALVGKTERWVQGLVQQGFIPRPARGVYRLTDVVRGSVDYMLARVIAAGPSPEVARQLVAERREHVVELEAALARATSKPTKPTKPKPTTPIHTKGE